MTGKASDHYDEEEELTRYVLVHHGSLMTKLEHQLIRTIEAEQKADAAETEAMASMLRSRWGRLSDDEAARALEAGPRDCRRGIRDRLLRDYAGQIQLNRCPVCHRIVRTPQAKQCLWCGHDWHQSTQHNVS